MKPVTNFWAYLRKATCEATTFVDFPKLIPLRNYKQMFAGKQVVATQIIT